MIETAVMNEVRCVMTVLTTVSGCCCDVTLFRKSASHEYGEVLKPNAETCGEVNLLGFSESCGSPGAWQLSMTSSTDKLSEEGTDEAAGSEHSSVPPVEQDAGGNPADR